MYSNRVLFCTDPDVNFDFFTSTTTSVSSMVVPPLYFTGIPWKIPYGKKVAISIKRGNRVTENATQF